MKKKKALSILTLVMSVILSVTAVCGCDSSNAPPSGGNPSIDSPGGDDGSNNNGSNNGSSDSNGGADNGSNGSNGGSDQPEAPKIKNVIYLIADGLSSSTIDVARDLKGEPLYLDEILLGQDVVVTANLTTLKEPSRDEAWKIANTDSSSCGTALATGRKTYKNGQGQLTHKDDNSVPYANDGVKTDWKNGETERFKSVLALAQEQGKKTAVITSADILDSTPSAFYSHSERGYWDTIYSDLKGSGIDVIVGTNSYGGNTLSSWRQDFSSKGYETVEYTDIDDFDKVTSGEKFISIGESGNGNHDPFWDYNNYRFGNIRLFDYFSKTLDLFDESDDGFFIMLEGGEIDIGGHNNVPEHAFSEIYAFDEVVCRALDYAGMRDDTIVVVAVDHGNSQYHYRGSSDLNSFNLSWDSETYFYNRFAEFTSWNNQHITKNYEGHTLENVMLAMYLPDGIENVFEGRGDIQNIEIPRFIANLLEIDIDKENRLYNGLEVEEAFGYIVVDFSESLTVGKNDLLTDKPITYWAVDTKGCGFLKASETNIHDRENIYGDTCYALKCFNEEQIAMANNGITITLPEPIDTKKCSLTSLTLRCQLSIDAAGEYPKARLYKNDSSILNDSNTNGISLAQYAHSKVVDVNLGRVDFQRLADSDGVIRSFTLGIRTKSAGYVYLDELRFGYSN